MSLTLGARQLLTFIKTRSRKTGYCWCRQETLAKALGVDVRTIGRRVAELVAAQLLTSERRGHGNHYTVLELAGKMSDRTQAVENTVEIAQNVRSDQTKLSDRTASPPITEIINTTNPSRREPSFETNENPEDEAVARTIRCSGFDPTPDLLAKLKRKQQFWRVTGFAVAAIIDRAHRKVAGTSNAPRGEGWFLAAVENELAGNRDVAMSTTRRQTDRGEQATVHGVRRDAGSAARAAVHETHSSPLAVSIERKPPEPATEVYGGFLPDIQQLVRLKSLGGGR